VSVERSGRGYKRITKQIITLLTLLVWILALLGAGENIELRFRLACANVNGEADRFVTFYELAVYMDEGKASYANTPILRRATNAICSEAKCALPTCASRVSERRSRSLSAMAIRPAPISAMSSASFPAS
jgi:hypothetical protein